MTRPTTLPRGIQVAADWSWRLVVIGVAGYLAIRGLAAVSVIAVPVAVAVLLTGLLRPVTTWVQRHSPLGRTPATAVTLVGAIVVVLGLLGAAGSTVIADFDGLSAQTAAGIDKVQEWLTTGPLQLSGERIAELIAQGREQLSANSSRLASGALSVSATVGHVFAGLLICLFATFFFLAQGEAIWRWCVRLLPQTSRERAHAAAARGWLSLTAYVRTQLIVAAVDAAGIALGAAVLRVPFVVPLAVLAFFGSLIPFVGAIVVGAFATLVALVVHGPVVAALMLGVVVLVLQIEGHVLQPFLMGHAVSLHPLAVLLTVAVGALLAGVVGAFFAVPVAALVNTVALYLAGRDPFPELADAPVTDQEAVASAQA
ncbi:MAG TPA: AI-2E family transporter [Dermatophilaceae bacterium]|nr:AI-2E family transporter [Dermatophilaceae bacterium]